MDLQTIEQNLLKQLEQNQTVEVKERVQYSIPVHTVQVSYHPVMRNAMDILMKMMLISFQKAKLKNVDVLADILLVEPLFIHDLTNKMLRLGMIEKQQEVFTLTAKGQAQLQSGIFEEELELTNHFVQYSPLHKGILEGDLDSLMDLEHFPEVFPYMDSEEIGEIDEAMLIAFIQKELSNEPAEDEVPTFITSVVSTESIQIYDVPILCFILYDEKEQRFIPRAYNVLTGAWDETIEGLLLENEKDKWQ